MCLENRFIGSRDRPDRVATELEEGCLPRDGASGDVQVEGDYVESLATFLVKHGEFLRALPVEGFLVDPPQNHAVHLARVRLWTEVNRVLSRL